MEKKRVRPKTETGGKGPPKPPGGKVGGGDGDDFDDSSLKPMD